MHTRAPATVWRQRQKKGGGADLGIESQPPRVTLCACPIDQGRYSAGYTGSRCSSLPREVREGAVDRCLGEVVYVIAERLLGDAENYLKHLGPGETGVEKPRYSFFTGPASFLNYLAGKAAEGFKPLISQGFAFSQGAKRVLVAAAVAVQHAVSSHTVATTVLNTGRQ